jgi:membrane associated rhomboid family serine protease
MWVEVGRFNTRTEADQNALVLVSMGIDCLAATNAEGTRLLVAARNVALARRELEAYQQDNRIFTAPAPVLRPFREGLAGTLLCCCALLFTYGAAGRETFSRDWLSAGAAQAGLIVDGEWWRAVTALGLHADYEHLLSNLVAGGLLGIILSQVLGGGIAWLLILLAGGIGNGFNALVQPPDHTAIGASTAVFGAVGILAVLMSTRQRAMWQRGFRRWLPLGVGVMLLAFLGVVGEHVDVGAHVAGLIVGAALGVLVVAVRQGPITQNRLVQWASGAAAFLLFAGAWLVALSIGYGSN